MHGEVEAAAHPWPVVVAARARVRGYGRLMAAAPELLEALRECEEILRELRVGDRGMAARAAIAKATGEVR